MMTTCFNCAPNQRGAVTGGLLMAETAQVWALAALAPARGKLG
jgi:hypothetical protein